MNKKKAMFIIPHLGSGGAERVVASLCNGLVDYGKIVLIFDEDLRQDLKVCIAFR
jgi:hypothetical protein